MKAYLALQTDVLDNGIVKTNRTGVDTISVFGASLTHHLSAGFPLLTTKKVYFKAVIAELLWFISGDTNVKTLQDQGVHIWDDWADETGSIGPLYGAQWRKWDAGDGVFIDQLANVMRALVNDPDSRRILMTAWNPRFLPVLPQPKDNPKHGLMALAPCHVQYQFSIDAGQLSIKMDMRSSDVFLGLPFNLASTALLCHMVAQQIGVTPGKVFITTGDTHIYTNHLDQVKEQLSRTPRDLPTLQIHRKPQSIFDYKLEDFSILGYDPYPALPAPRAV